MTTPNVLILRTAGTNCDEETKFAFELAGADAELLHVNRIFENRKLIDKFQIIAIPGGFTYGDDIAAGRILANELRYSLGDELRRFVDRGGLIIGICNGFQVLVKTGLLPGPFGENSTQKTTLTFNDSNLFEDRWVHLEAPENCSVFVDEGDELYLPVAHAEGKFIPADDAAISELIDRKQVVVRYAAPDGGEPVYPWNPNGSADSIAGICDGTGRIFGLMPHPERHCLPTQHPRWTRDGLKPEGDGLRIFRNAVKFAGQA